MKKQISSLSTIVILTALFLPSHAVKSAPRAAQYTPSNTEIVFDVDGVILRKKNSRVAKALWNHRGALSRLLFKDPRFACKTLKKIVQGSMPGDQLSQHFAKNHPDLSAMVNEITTDKEAISGTPEIIRALNQKGYTLGIATNMGTRGYQFYKQKLPEIFGVFSKAKAIDFESGHVLAKPNPAYFQDYLDAYADQTKPYKLFIDDRWDNVQAAAKKGFVAIHFKNPKQLRADLKKLGIM